MSKRLIKDFNIEDLIKELRQFSYTTEVEGGTVTVNVELFTAGQVPQATRLFLQAQGDRLADSILYSYDKEEITTHSNCQCSQQTKPWIDTKAE